MGIIGFGRIGQRTGSIARALGMKILANDKYESDSGREIATYVDREVLFARSDVIALHCPLFPDTEGIINKDTIAKMKDGVIILNGGRYMLPAWMWFPQNPSGVTTSFTGKELYYHAPYLLGTEGKPPEAYGVLAGESEGVCTGHPCVSTSRGGCLNGPPGLRPFLRNGNGIGT